MDKHVPANNKITGDKPSQHLFPKPVIRGHPTEGQNVSAKDRWSLNKGSFALYFGSRNPEKVVA